MVAEPILSVRDLVTEFDTRDGVVHAVEGVSFDLYPGEAIGIVGESGSGKSVTSMSILGLVQRPHGQVVSGEVVYEGRDLLKVSPQELRAIRGRDIAMIFQDPMTSLNPVISVGKQIRECLRTKNPGMSRSALRRRSVELLDLVGVPDPGRRVGQYPHEYSGGMRQRAMIAMAIANAPKVLIADEPTTALDVTIQAQVLDVLRTAQAETNAATVLITHDLGLVAEFASRVVVMYGGRVVETGDVESIFAEPRHPYTVGLLSSLPRLDTNLKQLSPIPGQPPSAVNRPPGCPFNPRCRLRQDRAICTEVVPALSGDAHRSACHFIEEVPTLRRTVEEEIGRVLVTTAREPAEADVGARLPPPASLELVEPSDEPAPSGKEILRVSGLKVHYPIKAGIFGRTVGTVRAVDGVDVTLRAGQTLGLVGESGCGKSTTGKTIMRLLEPTAGKIEFHGEDITRASRSDLRGVRRRMQMVFQDPYSSLDPRMTIRELIGEPLKLHKTYRGRDVRTRVGELMELVGLSPEHGRRYAHEFSGGQRQRIGIARAIALEPDLLVLDEPVSSLDVSIQAQIINLLMKLQQELGIAYLFIAHDLAVVRQISHEVAVMYLGRIVEVGERDEVFDHSTHPYTQSLLSAVPVPEPVKQGRRERIVLVGDVPNPAAPPPGCNFCTRCFKAQDHCREVDPDLEPHFGHLSACHFAGPRDLLT
ncbi:ABC transporter ATP-binding protein [Jiangella ureilytica]|uniref:ABC transporter ATP-binding protein n=1 Tax=Jiangella ureilytica TaxID=2530374 RepID=A0A4R4RSZ7_9ACTN|nr:ABC transporter ATP-binding protein [Jiangella ureilytica]TDC52754.1 ABC transporter ATP-binding protein [Jiangella ureilytica]